MKVVERNERSVATKFEMKVIRRKACKTAYTPTEGANRTKAMPAVVSQKLVY